MSSTYAAATPPAFGHAMLEYFSFTPGYVNLNHGSFGSVPLPVTTESQEISRGIESCPDKFMQLQAAALVAPTRGRIAKLVGAGPDEIVFVPNASHGINTVLKNFSWHESDIIITATTTYNAVERTVQYIRDSPPHPKISVFNIAFPTTRSAILNSFGTHLRALRRAQLSVQNSEGPKLKIVAVIDSIASHPGCYLPWKEMTQICREEGVMVVIDAAHSIGQEVDINLSEVKPDFWVSNCHKWLYAKRPCAVLYVPKRNQHIIKSPFPTPHSYVSPPQHADFIELFGWTGTIDFTPYLSVNPALDFRQWLGGEHKINGYCRILALAGGKRLADILGTSLLDKSGEFTLNMVNVGLPLSTRIPEGPATKAFFSQKLITGWNAYAATYIHNGKWWVRCSTQIWNEMSDFEYIGKALKEACQELEDKYRKEGAKL
ncbi:PLP-dependent transferase [Artomyces pyxidatus]|uniref:PLP-dependent transferase n=1 Tax=Artomyces pyxidatus TaxID=48021 RepID=A0ACB8TAS0_9AGAM|nr:PLP-dependent transferase [Artomyces pyxidatus]